MELIWKIIIAVLFAIITKYLFSFWTWWRESKKVWDAVSKIPGPPRHWLYGNTHQHPGPNEKGICFEEGLVNKYKKVFAIWIGPFAPIVYLCHPDTMKEVFSNIQHSDKPMKGLIGTYKWIEPWIGRGLITSGGEYWARNRRLLTPAFHFGVLKPYVDIYNNAARTLVSILEKGSNVGTKSIEIYQIVSHCTLEVILKCAFSLEVDIQGEMESEHSTYIDAVTSISQLIAQRFFNAFSFVDEIYFKTGAGRKSLLLCKLVHKVADDVIAKRKKAMATIDSGERPKKHLDFLDILLSAKDENGQGLSDAEIRQEVDTFLFAGHDTTASALSFTIYELSRHPECQDKAREEVMRVLKDKDVIEWDDLKKLEYTTMCIKEAMRLNTTVPHLGRMLNTNLEVEGVTLPPGTAICLALFSVHHNEHVWGKDYKEYRPERHSTDIRKEADPFAFVPFSAGHRNCIGQNFAMNEMRVAVASILKRLKISVDETHVVDRGALVTMRPINGIKVYVTPLTQNQQL